MSIIMGIEPRPRRKGSYTLALDDGRAFVVHEEVIVKYKLKSGMEVDGDQLQKWILEADTRTAYDMALRYLGYSARSKKQLYEYLARKGFSNEVIDAASGKLEEYRFLDDEDYAARFVRDKKAGKPAGRKLIAHELKGRGISQEILDGALENFSEEEEQQQALRLGEKYFNKYKELPQKECRVKVSQALQRRGFEWETVRSVLQRLQTGDDNCEDM
jgi:regulatory protein